MSIRAIEHEGRVIGDVEPAAGRWIASAHGLDGDQEAVAWLIEQHTLRRVPT